MKRSVEKEGIPDYRPAMLSGRDYMRQFLSRWKWSVTIILIALNIIAFLFQRGLLSEPFVINYLALSVEGLRQGFIWQLLTFQFMHGGWMHLLLNCWALFVFGRAVEWTIGKGRFLVLYFSSGVIGGLVQVLFSLFWPNYFGDASVGVSAAVVG